MNFIVNVKERLSFLSTGLVRRFNSVIRSLPTSLNVSLIVDHLVDKIGAKSEEESRKAELVYLLNEVIGGKILNKIIQSFLSCRMKMLERW